MFSHAYFMSSHNIIGMHNKHLDSKHSKIHFRAYVSFIVSIALNAQVIHKWCNHLAETILKQRSGQASTSDSALRCIVPPVHDTLLTFDLYNVFDCVQSCIVLFTALKCTKSIDPILLKTENVKYPTHPKKFP